MVTLRLPALTNGLLGTSFTPVALGHSIPGWRTRLRSRKFAIGSRRPWTGYPQGAITGRCWRKCWPAFVKMITLPGMRMFLPLAREQLAPRQMRQVVPKSIEIDPLRSAQMARIRARDTKPELRVRRALHAAGLRFRLHAKDLQGKPDLVFRSWRTAVFVHGCFWHRHQDRNCKLARLPKTKLEFWKPKLESNRARDLRVRADLEAQGWVVIEVWECRTRPEHLRALALRLKKLRVTRTLGKRRSSRNETRV
jgi:DNA mismatch endonuclease, patch repair protein